MNNTPFSTNLYGSNDNDVKRPWRRSSISYFAEEDEAKVDISTFDDSIFRPENVFSNNNFTTTTVTKLDEAKVDISTFDDAIAYPNNHQNQKPPPPPPPPPTTISSSSSVVTPDPPMMSRKRKKDDDNDDDRYYTTQLSSVPRFRSHQAEGWMSKYEELLDYRLQFGHCLVPNQYSDNPSLAEWVKRQRYQYKLKGMGKHSSMSNDRIIALEKLGFVWNSHDAVWEERLKELEQFKHVHHGNTNVPSLYPPNPQLAIWVKRQRRQYKFLCEGKSTTMTKIRVNMLREIDFSWSGRRNKSSENQPEYEQQLCETADDLSWPDAEVQKRNKRSGLTLTTKRTMV
ncbi:MAG: hypothetical protein ACI90V_000370 [Bacillariaceae sp.]|jgi:hypothetical protein